MKFYCKAYEKNKVLILDVENLEDLHKWWVSMNISEWDEKDQSSMIEILGVNSEVYKNPKEGSWYELDGEFWKGFIFDSEKFSKVIDKEASTIIRLGAIAPERKINFQNYKV